MTVSTTLVNSTALPNLGSGESIVLPVNPKRKSPSLEKNDTTVDGAVGPDSVERVEH
jgi:hypothetical protein